MLGSQTLLQLETQIFPGNPQAMNPVIALALIIVLNWEITAHLVTQLPWDNSDAENELTCKNGGTFFKGKCHCPKRWTGPYCTCLQDVVTCIAPSFNVECMGNGKCECGDCRCKKWYSGRYCEIVSPFIKDDPKQLDKLVDDVMHKLFIDITMYILTIDQSEKTFSKLNKITSELDKSDVTYQEAKSRLNALYFQLLLRRRKHRLDEENEVGSITDDEFDSLSNELSNESRNLHKIIEIDIPEDAEPQMWTTQLDLDNKVHGLTTDWSLERSVDTVYRFSFFEIENRTFGIHTYNLTLSMLLDREEEDFYKMDILDSRGSLYAMLAITVLDISDNAPIFQQSAYSFDVTHADELTTFRVQAVDLDDGENGIVTYRLVSEDDRFSLDSETGQFRLKSPSTVTNNTRIQIEAADNGNPSMSGRSTIIINSDVTGGPTGGVELKKNNVGNSTGDNNVTSSPNDTIPLETESNSHMYLSGTNTTLVGIDEIGTTSVPVKLTDELGTAAVTQSHNPTSLAPKIPIFGDNNYSSIGDDVFNGTATTLLTEVTTSKVGGATRSSTSFYFTPHSTIIQRQFRHIYDTVKTDPARFIDDFRYPTASDVYMFPNSSYVLECHPNGHPQPGISWKYSKFSSRLRYAKRIENGSNDRIFVQKTFSLHIVNVCYENSGWYACIASNSEGTVRQKRRIFVVDSANYTRNLTEKLKIELGKPTQIECKPATGLRYPHVVSWNKDPGRIDFSNVNRKKNALTIKTAMNVDKGNYTCIVSSKLEGPKRYTMILY